MEDNNEEYVYEYEYELPNHRTHQTTPKQTEERVYEDPKPANHGDVAQSVFSPTVFKLNLTPAQDPTGRTYYHGEVKSGRQEYWLNAYPKESDYKAQMPGGAVKTQVLHLLDELKTTARLDTAYSNWIGCFAGFVAYKNNEQRTRLNDHSFIIVPPREAHKPYTLLWFNSETKTVLTMKRTATRLKYETQ